MALSEEILLNIKSEYKKVTACNTEQIPLVSVIIPTYNTEKYILKCLNSILNQTIKRIEAIVVDDGSTDNTAEIVSEYAKYDSRVKLIKQEHLKQGAARNLGMKFTSGDYIGYVDSDDWIDLDYYEKLYNSAIKYNADIAIATNIRIGKGKTKKRLNFEEEKFITNLQEKIDVTKTYKNPCPTNKIYRKSLLLDNNINWDEGVFCEDKLFTMKAVFYANGIVTVPGINYYYYRNPTSTVNTKTKEHLEKLIRDKNNAKLSVLKFLRDNNADVRDGDYWATIDEIKIFDFKILVKKGSLKSYSYLLFGLVPIYKTKRK